MLMRQGFWVVVFIFGLFPPLLATAPCPWALMGISKSEYEALPTDSVFRAHSRNLTQNPTSPRKYKVPRLERVFELLNKNYDRASYKVDLRGNTIFLVVDSSGNRRKVSRIARTIHRRWGFEVDVFFDPDLKRNAAELIEVIKTEETFAAPSEPLDVFVQRRIQERYPAILFKWADIQGPTLVLQHEAGRLTVLAFLKKLEKENSDVDSVSVRVDQDLFENLVKREIANSIEFSEGPKEILPQSEF